MQQKSLFIVKKIAMNRLEFFNNLNNSEYGKKYLDLIQKAKDTYYNVENDVTELHHVYPRSFEEGRIDTEDNLVKLTVFDHIIAHYFLARAIRNQHTCHAFRMMCDLHLDSINLADKETILKLEECAILRREGRVRSPETLEKQRQVVLGRINISLHGKEKKVYPEEYESIYRKQGWVRKRANKVYNPSKGKIWIHNSDREICIYESEFYLYEKDGWLKGRIRSSTKGKIRMIKDGKIKYATQETLQQMLNEGYRRGATQGRKKAIVNGKIKYIVVGADKC